MEKSKILVLSSTYPRWKNDHEPGFVHELCRRLVASHEVHVLCPHSNNSYAYEILDGVHVHRYRYAPEFLETLVHDGGILENIRKSRWKLMLLPAFFFSQMINIYKIVHKIKPLVIHAHWIIPQGLTLVAMTLLKINLPPVVITSHGGDIFRMKNKNWVRLKRSILSTAKKVTVVSHKLKREVLALGIDSAFVSVRPMGVDFDTRFKQDFSTVRNQHELLYVGRLTKGKGVESLIDIFPKLVKDIPSITLTIVGDGPERVNLEMQVEKYGLKEKINFVGSKTQDVLPAFFQKASLFIAPFIEEQGLGLVILEAIGCGCPVLVGYVQAVDDIFYPHTELFTFNSDKKEEMCLKIIDRVNNSKYAKYEMEEIRKRVIEKYNWVNVSNSYKELINSVISGGKSGAQF